MLNTAVRARVDIAIQDQTKAYRTLRKRCNCKAKAHRSL